MNNKAVSRCLVVLAGLVVLGSIGFAVLDGRKRIDRTADYREVAKTNERALAQAKAVAREKMRDELRKREKELAREEGEEAVLKRKAQAERRRAVVRRRLFGSSAAHVSAAYMKASEMPTGEPTEEDQEIIDLAGESASEVDLDTAAEVAEAALKSQDPRARIAAVEMLSALGEVGLVDIGEFLTDKHPEVANLAADRWELGVQNVMDDAERTALVKVGLLAITDEDQLRSMVGTLMLTTDELLVIRTVTDVMRDGERVQREAVKSAYESVTGEPWKDEKTAEAWLQANYTPPEPDETEDNP